MRRHLTTQVALLGFLMLLTPNPCCAQNLACNEVTAISRMAESRSNQHLLTWKKKAGDSYIARLVFSFRSFELNAKRRSVAEGLLSLVPPSKEQEPLWRTLDGFLCREERVEEVKTLAQLQARMPRDIARAVLLVPEKLPDYVSYAYDAVQDPHNDYAVQMRSVCRARHKEFVAAVASLAPNDRQWFVKKIFNPDGCRPIAVPEAD